MRKSPTTYGRPYCASVKYVIKSKYINWWLMLTFIFFTVSTKFAMTIIGKTCTVIVFTKLIATIVLEPCFLLFMDGNSIM